MVKLVSFVKKTHLILVGLIITFLLLFFFVLYNVLFIGRVYPNIFIAEISVGGKTPEMVREILEEKFIAPKSIFLYYEKDNFEIILKNTEFGYDFENTIKRVYEIPRTGNIFNDFAKRIKLLFNKNDVGVGIKINEILLEAIIDNISEQISDPPTSPSISVVNGNIEVEKGKVGSVLDKEDLRIKIGNNLTFNVNDKIEVKTKQIDPTLTPEELAKSTKRANNLLNKVLELKFEYQNFLFKGRDLIAIIDPKGTYFQEKISQIIDNTAKEIEREPQDPILVFESGIVKEFLVSRDGVKIDREKIINQIVEGLNNLETTDAQNYLLEIPVVKTSPKITTGEINNLGIKELIGRGKSRFAGSISNRIHNLSLAANRFKGTLIKPGEEFSFNNTLGDVSGLTGYKQAYVIKDGRTVLGDGGGVCQVSTTFFRAALDAGLPILERRAHAYRVGYYEQDSPPGLDSTVFFPTTDLKIKNDTSGHILIQPIVDTKNYTLIFEFYGTKDGRVSKIDKPVVTNVTAPGEDIYQDDPTLPTGTIKQIEHRAFGAKVTANYTVSRDGKIIYQKKFISNYQPWQAVYLRGTGPVQ